MFERPGMGREAEMSCGGLWEMLNYRELKTRWYGGGVAQAWKGVWRELWPKLNGCGFRDGNTPQGAVGTDNRLCVLSITHSFIHRHDAGLQGRQRYFRKDPLRCCVQRGDSTWVDTWLEPSRSQALFLGSQQVSKGQSGTDFCHHCLLMVAKAIWIDGANPSKAVCSMNTHEGDVT